MEFPLNSNDKKYGKSKFLRMNIRKMNINNITIFQGEGRKNVLYSDNRPNSAFSGINSLLKISHKNFLDATFWGIYNLPGRGSKPRVVSWYRAFSAFSVVYVVCCVCVRSFRCVVMCRIEYIIYMSYILGRKGGREAEWSMKTIKRKIIVIIWGKLNI